MKSIIWSRGKLNKEIQKCGKNNNPSRPNKQLFFPKKSSQLIIWIEFFLYLILFIENRHYDIKSKTNHTVIIIYTHLPSHPNCERVMFLVNIYSKSSKTLILSNSIKYDYSIIKEFSDGQI